MVRQIGNPGTSISDRDKAGIMAVVCADAVGRVTDGPDALSWRVDAFIVASLIAAALG